MNTNQLKKFAKEARIKLITQIGVKLDFVLTQDTAELRGKSNELEQLRSKLIEQGREQLIETVAYTWFNRIMALRFMDANGYNIPKVVTPLPGMSNPEILQNSLAGNIEEDLKLDRQRLNDLIDGRTSSSDAQTEAFKMLLVASCNKWHTAMPFMFERISDYTELLLPDDLLSDFSIVSDIRNGMSDEDCQKEELIGWLYQFYISDKKDDVFDGLKKNVKISAENIPAATQIFTPRWIVQYMVENTLGKLWLTFKPESKLRQQMPYFIDTPEGNFTPPLPEGIKGITDITFLDPCQGSGHVLVYAFDLLIKIYEEEGYNNNEIPSLILEHNLFGIDIDERAAQLASFALTMKARSYYSRFLKKPIQPHVIALENVSEDLIKQAIQIPLAVEGKLIYDHRDLTLFNLTQANNFGSLIKINLAELSSLQIQKGSIWQTQELKLKEQAIYLSREYSCVVTNPPYMGVKGMNDGLKLFIQNLYPTSKSDLMACFMERCMSMTCSNGKSGMINQHSWMFLSSYEELRPLFIEKFQIESLLHLGPRTFPEIGGEVVQNATFVFGKYLPSNKGIYLRLTEFDDAKLKESKTLEAISNSKVNYLFKADQKKFELIPSSPICYWVSDTFFQSFNNTTLNDLAYIDGKNVTGNNDKFMRFHWEISKLKHFNEYIPTAKGGDFRKWMGNTMHLVNWTESARKEYRSTKSGRLIKEELWYKKGITFSRMASIVNARLIDDRGTFDGTTVSFFLKNDNSTLLQYIQAFFNSCVGNYYIKVLNPTLVFQFIDIKKIPIIKDDNFQMELIQTCNEISLDDWNKTELSLDFKKNELIRINNNKDKLIIDCIEEYDQFWKTKFLKIHNNEIEINRQFINIYNLQDELNESVPIEQITILQEESKIINNEFFIDPIPVLLQFISYSIGCIFGRYSIDKSDLILANQAETIQDFLNKIPEPTFMPDEDNIIPFLEGEWFNDDVVGRFKEFLKAAFTESNFVENLRYIEETMIKDIRKYFVKDFYNDHIKRYKKRPIYWMFSSPKGHFKALIYIHRYQPDLCSKMLNDYLQPFINKLEAAKQTNTLQSLREDVSAREKTIALKEVDRLEFMIRDCKDYERTLFTIATQKLTIDLDDGVKVNYLKFKEVLVPIKGLEKEED